MSSEARLAYHGVPRVLPPESPGEVPDCLTVEAIHHGMCCCVGADSSGGVAKKGGGHCADSSGGVVKEEGGAKDVCAQCQELALEWPDFITYLSASRININVRQVVSDKKKF